MNRRRLLAIAAGIVGLALIGALALLLLVQTQYFRDTVRTKIVNYAEAATGGKIDIGSFRFDWHGLHAVITDLVIHGTEGPDQKPLLTAKKVDLVLKLLPGLRHAYELESLTVDQPSVNVIVYPDGHTNVPSPKVKPESKTTVLEDVVDLAIHRFEVRGGSLQFAQRPSTFAAQGENLLAQLSFDTLAQTYTGQLTMSPLYVQYDGQQRVNLNVALPLHFERDKIQVNNATIASGSSRINLTGTLEHLTDPKTSFRLNASVGLEELKRSMGLPLDLRAGNLPGFLTADIAGNTAKGQTTITAGRVELGESSASVAGTLESGGLNVESVLALPQLAKLFDAPSLAQGGQAKLAGLLRKSGDAITLEQMRLAALGGELDGRGALENGRILRFNGNFRQFDLQNLTRLATGQAVGYAGVLGGNLELTDDLKAKGTSGLLARGNVGIAPGRKGVPVKGELHGVYSGASGVVELSRSYVELPSSRLDLSGSLNKDIQVNLVSRNLDDFRPALSFGSSKPAAALPVTLERGGSVAFQGNVAGQLATPRITGHLAAANSVLEDRRFDRLDADLNASSSGVSVQNGAVTRGNLQAQISASVGLHNWTPEQYEPVNANIRVQNADVADLLALAGDRGTPLSGAMNAEAHISGTIGNPQGAANLNVANGSAYGYRFDQAAVNLNLSDRLVRLTSGQVTSGTAKVSLTGTFEHPRDSFESGHFQLQLASNQVGLEQFRPVNAKTLPLSGTVGANATAVGDVVQVKGGTEIRVTAVNGDVTGRAIHYQGENLGDVTASARTSGNKVDYKLTAAPFQGSVQISGQTLLTTGYPTTADVNVSGVPAERLAALADQRNLPVSGRLSATGHFAGTLSDPHLNLEFNLDRGKLYEQIDSARAQIDYSNNVVRIRSARIVKGPAHVDFSGDFTHPNGAWDRGVVNFNVDSNEVQLAQLQELQKIEPGFGGLAQVRLKGSGRLQDVKGQPPLLLTALDGDVKATGLSINKEQLGDLTLTAATHGQALDVKLDSDIAHSKIAGSGTVQLANDYPVQARLTFTGITYAGLRPFFGERNTGLAQALFDGTAEGSASIAGPLLKPDDLTATLQIPKLELTAIPRGQLAGRDNRVTLKNDGTLTIALSKSTFRIENAHITGPQTDVKLTGTAALSPKQALSLQMSANVDLSVIQNFNHNVYSGGSIVLQAAVNGTLTDPRVNGQIQLKNASFNMIDAPNGISNANGVIALNGKSAVIQSLTAESGGGTISVTGSAGYGAGTGNFRLAATANSVRVRYPEGLSTTANANVTLSGTTDRSTLAGTITVQRIAFNPHSDFGSLLSSAAPPVPIPANPNTLLGSIHLQIQVRTAPGVQFQTSLAQHIQAVADLRVRGTLDEPDVLGRVNITQGNIIFFGTKYTVNEGTISFYDPTKIVPTLDIDLETNVQGVDIILTVSGPADNLTLTHRSDPPLPFEQVLALLAAGTTPTDPTIAARQPQAPPQSAQQLGESALLGQVVANPISDRLSRVFGITSLKIAPAFVTGAVLPQARLTLSQQVTRNVNFTYITDLANSNTQIFQIEWAISPIWSAVATRDDNGLFGVDFYYKKKFK